MRTFMNLLKLKLFQCSESVPFVSLRSLFEKVIINRYKEGWNIQTKYENVLNDIVT